MYSLKGAFLLLKKLGIGVSSDRNFLKDESGQFSLYCHAPSRLGTDCLLKDQLSYVLSYGNKASDRRIVYLLDLNSKNDLQETSIYEYAAVFIQCEEINKKNLEILLLNTSPETEINLTTNNSYQELLRNLYSKISGWLVSIRIKQMPDGKEMLLPYDQNTATQKMGEVIPYLQASYSKINNFKFQCLQALHASPDLIFTEMLRQLLLTPGFSPVNPEQVAQRFTKICFEAFIDAIEKIKHQEQKYYDEINHLIHEMTGLATLLGMRSTVSFETMPLEKLFLIKKEDLRRKDELQKGIATSIIANCQKLTLGSLVTMLEHLEENTLVDFLKETRTELLATVEAWEKKLDALISHRQNEKMSRSPLLILQTPIIQDVTGMREDEILSEEQFYDAIEVEEIKGKATEIESKKNSSSLVNTISSRLRSEEIEQEIFYDALESDDLNMHEFISSIIKLMAIPTISSVPNLPPDASRIFEYYYYPSQVFTADLLLGDQLNYFLTHRYKLSDRRVGFILKCQNSFLNVARDMPILAARMLALWVEYENVDHKVAQELNDLLALKSELIEKNFLPSCKKLLKMLYHSVKCWIIELVDLNEKATAAQKSSLYFIPYFVSSFEQYVVQFQPVYTQPQCEIVFTQCMIDLLLHGKLVSVDIKQSYLKFLNTCAVVLKKYLMLLEGEQSRFVEKFHKLFSILIKYKAVLSIRSKLNFQHQSLFNLEKIQQLELSARKKIYDSVINTEGDTINLLHLTELVYLIILIENKNFSQILSYLKKLIQPEFSELQKWENNLTQAINEHKASWNTFFPWIGRKAIGYFYQNTFIGVGSEISRLIVQTFSENSITLAISKWTGILAGVIYTYYAGSYSLARLLLISGIGYLLQEQLGEYQINDAKAKLIPPKIQLRGLLNFIKIASIIVGGLETAITRDFIYFIKSVGGISGSIGLVTIAQHLLLNYQTHPDQFLTEEKFLVLFFSSLVGSEIGYYFSDIFYRGIDKWFMRDKFIEVFCETLYLKNSTGCSVDFAPNPIWSPRFWLNANDTARVSWTEQRQFYETACDIVKYTNDQRAVLCETPSLIDIKRLGSGPPLYFKPN